MLTEKRLQQCVWGVYALLLYRNSFAERHNSQINRRRLQMLMYRVKLAMEGQA